MYRLTEDLQDDSFCIGLWEETNFLDDQEIRTLLESVAHKNLDKASIGNNQLSVQYDDAKLIRNNYITRINYDKTNKDLCNLFKKIYSKIIEVNKKRFKFNLTDIESFQFTSYIKGEYYNKHIDLGNNLNVGNTQRKLSFSIQLSDPSEYEGGDLCVYSSDQYVTASKQKGTISFFPSFMLHEVKEVTKGKRLSLVGWVWGPRFV